MEGNYVFHISTTVQLKKEARAWIYEAYEYQKWTQGTGPSKGKGTSSVDRLDASNRISGVLRVALQSISLLLSVCSPTSWSLSGIMSGWDAAKKHPLPNDTESARTRCFFAQQPRHSNRQTSRSADFDRLLQSFGVQDERCPESRGNYCGEAIWECGPTQSSQTSLSRTGKARISGPGARPGASRVSKARRTIATPRGVGPSVEDVS